MNVSQIRLPFTPQNLQRTSSSALDKDAEFINLSLLNKQARVRLSPEALDLSVLPGKPTLFAIANAKGWFAAVTRAQNNNIAIALSPLSELREAFSSATEETTDAMFSPKRTVILTPAIPNTITFACNDTRLVVGLIQGPVLVLDTATLFTPGSDEVAPLRSFSSTTASAVRELLANPGDLPDLVAILREPDGNVNSQNVEILDVRKLESIGGWRIGNEPNATPTALSWSTRGKQLAIGLQSGDIITFSPTASDTPKIIVPKSPETMQQAVISTTWLSNPDFHVVYSAPGPIEPSAEQNHMIVSMDVKRNSATDYKLSPPCFPIPGLRPPASYSAILRNWSPAKTLIFIGDACSSDISLIGCMEGDAHWYSMTLDDTSIPAPPLDKEGNDTVLVALEFDLTSTEPFYRKNSTLEMPPQPIMYVYASDGTVNGWNVINTTGKAYPGMVNVGPTPQTDATVDMNTETPVPIASSFTATQPAFPSFATAQPSTFAGFNQPAPTFAAQNTFGQSAQPSATPFGQTKSTFPAAPIGFGAALGTTPTFGQAGFGFGASPPATVESADSPEDPMGEEDSPALGGMSLGSETPNANINAPITSSVFGQAAFSGSSLTPASSSGNSSFIKPATGFGAFGSQQSSSSLGATSSWGVSTASTTPTETKSGFGQSGFASRAPAQTSVFGKSTFGTAPASPKGGGFSAFATNTTSFTATLGAKSPDSKPSWAAPSETSSSPTKPTNDPFSAFTQGLNAFGPSVPTPAPAWGSATITKAGGENTKSVFGSDGPLAAGSTVFGGGAVADLLSNASTDSAMAAASTAFGTSPFKSSATTQSSGGAFGGLKASSIGFKPAEGFGAFGEPPADSPFLKAAKPTESKPVSAFAVKPSTLVSAFASQPTTKESPTPVFGSPSVIGSGLKFGTASPAAKSAPATSPVAKTAGGFAAYANVSSFTSAKSDAGSASFADMLRASKGPEKDGVKSSTPIFGSPQPASVFSANATERSHMPTSVFNTGSAVAKAKADEALAQESEVKKEAHQKIVSEKPVALSSAASSYADVEQANEETDKPISDDGEAEVGDGDEEVEEVEEDDDALDDTRSFLSGSFEDDESLPEHPSANEDDAEGDTDEGSHESHESTPAAKDTPIDVSSDVPSRSLSVTPKPLVDDKKPSPSEHTSSSPPLDKPEGQPAPSPKISTQGIPPVVVDLPSSGAAKPAVVVQPPVALSPPTSSPFSGLGLGRPSTRPNRSSPLASAEPLSGSAPSSLSSTSKTAVASDISSIANRHKTPPLLSAFGPSNPLQAPVSSVGSTTHVSERDMAGLATEATPPPRVKAEEGMQTECAMLFAGLGAELEDTRKVSVIMAQKKENISHPSDHVHQLRDIGNAANWTLGDAKIWGHVLTQLTTQIDELKDKRHEISQLLRELDNNLLKAMTKKEEIARFNKTKSDPNFSKMLKVRTLGPEQLETQSRLRKLIRTARDRIDTLESHLRESKRKLERSSSGRPGMRAPALQTVNETYKNIAIALQERSQDISNIQSRWAQLDTPSRRQTWSRYDSQVSPPTAATTTAQITPQITTLAAAALNAERSAQSLKNALLARKSGTRLNSQVVGVAASVSVYDPPIKDEQKDLSFAWEGMSFQMPLTSVAASIPAWMASPDLSQLSTGGSRSRGGGSKHGKSVPLKGSASPSPDIANFDWGLPGTPPKRF